MADKEEQLNKIGIFADLHIDTVPDAEDRLDLLIEKFKNENVDFIISLGDLCRPIEENLHIINKMKLLPFPCYFCIGNHASDNHSIEEVIKFKKMDHSYYSVTFEGIKYIFLACYYLDNKKPFIPEEQLEWLENQLKDESNKIILSHHSLVNDFGYRGIINRKEVRAIIDEANNKKGKVLLCMNGHDHGSSIKEINGVFYYTLNSSSNIWHGQENNHTYSKEKYEEYPDLTNLILYKEPLHVIMKIDRNKEIEILGMKGNYDTITPNEVGIGDSWNGVSIKPETLSLSIGKDNYTIAR